MPLAGERKGNPYGSIFHSNIVSSGGLNDILATNAPERLGCRLGEIEAQAARTHYAEAEVNRLRKDAECSSRLDVLAHHRAPALAAPALLILTGDRHPVWSELSSCRGSVPRAVATETSVSPLLLYEVLLRNAELRRVAWGQHDDSSRGRYHPRCGRAAAG
jgi:hypothetical protein